MLKDDSVPCAIIFIGLQASGKSTFYEKNFSVGYAHINLDTLRTRHREKLCLDDCFAKRKSFVVDNTNPTKDDRQRYIPSAKAAGYRIIGYYFRSALRECLSRNEKRERVVKPIALAHTSKILELPSLDEGFDELWYVSIGAEQGAENLLNDFIVKKWEIEAK